MSEPIDIGAERTKYIRFSTELLPTVEATNLCIDAVPVLLQAMDELEVARRCAAAFAAMQKWEIGLKMNPGWFPYQATRCELNGFYLQAEDDAYYNTPLEAIEAAAAWLEK